MSISQEACCEMNTFGGKPTADFQPSDIPAMSIIIGKLAAVLERLIVSNAHRGLDGRVSINETTSKFQCSYPPVISILSYLQRLRKYSNCSDSCFVVLLIYVDRIIESRRITLTCLNVHRVILTAVLISSKFHDDIFYNNAFYAKLGGISAPEMNILEIEFLKMINFSLFVDSVAYEKYYTDLVNFNVPELQEEQQLFAKTGASEVNAWRPTAQSPSSVAHGIDVSNFASWPSPQPCDIATYHYPQQCIDGMSGGAYGMVNTNPISVFL